MKRMANELQDFGLRSHRQAAAVGTPHLLHTTWLEWNRQTERTTAILEQSSIASSSLSNPHRRCCCLSADFHVAAPLHHREQEARWLTWPTTTGYLRSSSCSCGHLWLDIGTGRLFIALQLTVLLCGESGCTYSGSEFSSLWLTFHTTGIGRVSIVHWLSYGLTPCWPCGKRVSLGEWFD